MAIHSFFSQAATSAAGFNATGQSGAAETKSGHPVADAAEEILGKNAFLELLTTQLRYQDPLNPIDDQNFIAQMAQFSALEQMQNLTVQLELFMEHERSTNRLAQATALLGRQVEVVADDAMVAGEVEAVVMVDGVPRLSINDNFYNVEQVVSILT